MEFAGSRYYRLNRIMFTCLGLWPYYTRCAHYIHFIFLSPFLLSGLVFQLSAFITKEYSMELFLDILTFSGPSLICIFQYFNLFFHSKTTKNLFERIRYDWNSLKEKEELQILRKRAKIGKHSILILILLTYTMLFICVLIIFGPTILNIIVPLNESQQSVLHLPNSMEYFIDQEKYIYLLTIYFFLIVFVGATVLITAQSFGVMCINHTCAMFEITSYRIECMVNRSQMNSSTISKSDTFKNIVEAINSHRKAIEYADSLKLMCESSHLLIIPVGTGALSITLFRLCEYITADIINIDNIIISFFYIICHLAYMFVGNYLGQLIIDHSNDVFKQIYNTRWYATPLYVQKCLLLMMQRSMKSCTLMIGSLFLPSLQGYATLINASLSYCMVIYSRCQSKKIDAQ
ncbi:Odorant receptor 277 [Nylanderia fulva]|uniref:Odorant receptor n=1 Tax=Nylanderia fulva TaxID=613905 RepID=A0A6G1LP26_9HYME|nr:Odorant receptor 277 [Nylanderia fulva]